MTRKNMSILNDIMAIEMMLDTLRAECLRNLDNDVETPQATYDKIWSLKTLLWKLEDKYNAS